MVDPRRYLPFEADDVTRAAERFGARVALPMDCPGFELAGVGSYGVDETIDYVDVYVFDHVANEKSDDWQWARVRTERLLESDSVVMACERAAEEFIQEVLRGDSIEEAVMRAVEEQTERELLRCDRSDVTVVVDDHLLSGVRIEWSDPGSGLGYWFTTVAGLDAGHAVTIIGPAGWNPGLRA